MTQGNKMMFRIFCVALFACSLTFAGCDESNDGLNDPTVTTDETFDTAGDPTAEMAVDADAAADTSVDVVEVEEVETTEAVSE